jgi:hypothetical protein
MAALGSSPLGVGALAGDNPQAAPSATVTAPSGTLTSSTITATWTYSSPVSRTQTKYRVRLMSQNGATTLYDGGIVVSAATSATLDVLLSGGSTYLVSVSVFDGFSWSETDGTSTFVYDASSVEDYPDEPGVGSVYEVAINGTGYMLADHPERPGGWERRVIPLDPQRLATGDTPFSEAIDRYTLIGISDWSDGAGQALRDRDSSSKLGYSTSDGINPFTPGQLKLLPGTSQLLAETYATQLAVVAGGKLYVTTDAKEITEHDDPTDATPTVFSVAGGSTVLDFCSDGYFWYWCDGANIFRNSTAADPGAAWSASNAEVMAWCSDRLIIARKGGSSSTPNVVVTMNYSSGAEVGTPWSFEEETDVRSITSGDGYAFWAAARWDRSVVYAWQLGSADAPFVGLELPTGQDIQSVGYYQGNVFVRASETTTGSSKRAIIYRCAASSGRLTPDRVLDIDEAGVDHSAGGFAGDDRFVLFPWKGMGTYSGVGCIDLSTGGWSKWLEAPANTGVVQSVVQWYGRTVFTIGGYGVVLEDVAVGSDDGSTSTGTLETSLIDLGTSVRKVFHRVDMTFDPLPSGAEIQLSYSLDGGNSWLATSPVVSADGAKTAYWDLNVEGDSIALKVTLTHGSTSTPIVRSITVRVHPIGIADQVLIMTVNCADRVNGLNGRELPSSGPGKGMERLATLEALAQTRVRVQDIDWPTNDTAQIYDLVAVEAKRVGVFTRHVNRQTNTLVANLTLRRAFK